MVLKGIFCFLHPVCDFMIVILLAVNDYSFLPIFRSITNPEITSSDSLKIMTVKCTRYQTSREVSATINIEQRYRHYK